ncbi:MAG TPA: 50S ribosomal protein L29 [Candidatus Paceibacterota bacterium]|nr:50S ribosomal protein L29 [Candidatus Paceibacterota bacterium]
MKKNPTKTMAPAELEKFIKEKREELRTLRFSAAGARAKDPSQFHKVKRDIARALTELQMHASAAAGAPKLKAQNA